MIVEQMKQMIAFSFRNVVIVLFTGVLVAIFLIASVLVIFLGAVAPSSLVETCGS